MILVTIIAIAKETDQCKTFVLKSSEPLQYKAGQFITFLMEQNGITERRSYSFSSSPDIGEQPSITIKRNDNGIFSRWWIDEAKPGDQLEALHPAGAFTLAFQEKPRDIFLTAAGSGITPVYSIIKSALIKEKNSKIHLVYSNSTVSEAIFYEQIKLLEEQYPDQLTVDWFFSNHKDLLVARLSTYNLQRIISLRLKYSLKEALMFTCGPFYYMQMVQITCLSMGFEKQKIRRELFDINLLPPLPKRNFDTTDRWIKIRINNNTIPILVKWSQTILEAALQQGIDLPYNCASGKCSTCVCKIISGKIWMHYNEVLTDDDEEKGLVLTCTGHPVTNNVIIQLEK